MKPSSMCILFASDIRFVFPSVSSKTTFTNKEALLFNSFCISLKESPNSNKLIGVIITNPG